MKVLGVLEAELSWEAENANQNRRRKWKLT